MAHTWVPLGRDGGAPWKRVEVLCCPPCDAERRPDAVPPERHPPGTLSLNVFGGVNTRPNGAKTARLIRMPVLTSPIILSSLAARCVSFYQTVCLSVLSTTIFRLKGADPGLRSVAHRPCRSARGALDPGVGGLGHICGAPPSPLPHQPPACFGART